MAKWLDRFLVAAPAGLIGLVRSKRFHGFMDTLFSGLLLEVVALIVFAVLLLAFASAWDAAQTSQAKTGLIVLVTVLRHYAKMIERKLPPLDPPGDK